MSKSCLFENPLALSRFCNSGERRPKVPLFCFKNAADCNKGKCATIKREPTRENIHGPGLLLLDDAARLK